jgi:imidazolonepropionase-like amidohydrolase
MRHRSAAAFVFALLVTSAYADDRVVAFVGVNVVPMDSERVLAGQTVIVRGGTVSEVGPVGGVDIPAEATVIYGRGRYLVPGLIDMHVHVRAEDLPRYIENGITTVRDLAGLDSVLTAMHRVERGDVPGPRILPSSRLLNGPNPFNPHFSTVVASAADADRIVAAQLARGCHSIKVYENLPLNVYEAIVAAARARGVKVTGHVSHLVPVRHAMTMQDGIEHLEGYDAELNWESPDASRMQELAIASRDAGAWNCPTLRVFTEHITRDMPADRRARYLAGRRAFVSALHAAGARILAGTDAGYLIPAGVSLHDELDELHAAGLSRYETLSAATRSAAEYLADPAIGTIAAGARADLVLVIRNPLEDLSTLRYPSGVMVNGTWMAQERERRRSVRH